MPSADKYVGMRAVIRGAAGSGDVCACYIMYARTRESIHHHISN